MPALPSEPALNRRDAARLVRTRPEWQAAEDRGSAANAKRTPGPTPDNALISDRLRSPFLSEALPRFVCAPPVVAGDTSQRRLPEPRAPPARFRLQS